MALVVTALLAALTATPEAAEIRRAADRVFDADYQQRLPHEAEPGVQEAGARPRRMMLRRGRRRREPRQRARAPQALGSVAQVLMYIVIGVVLVITVFWFSRELAGYVDDPEAEDEDAPGGARADPRDAVVSRPLGDANGLAAQGLFGEALHALLLRTLEELVKVTRVGLPASMTSREIIERISMPDSARSALTGLITAVEVTHFGDDVPTENDFQRCLGHFQQFAAAYRGAPA